MKIENLWHPILRRAFLKILGAGTFLTLFGRKGFSVTPERPHVAKVPRTAFEAPEGTWTLVLLPDTQIYAEKYPQVYQRQTEWIAANREAHNILFVAHEGDIVNHAAIRPQWENAQAAMRVLHSAGIPYSLLPGNHDLLQDKEGQPSSILGATLDANGQVPSGKDKPWIYLRNTLMNEYFQKSDYRNSEAFGLFEPEKMENSWHAFSTPAGKVLLFALEYSPRDAVLEWASKVAGEKSDHIGIVVTHAYTYSDDTRYDWAAYGDAQQWSPRNKDCRILEQDGGTNDGEDVWKKLVSINPNIRFVFSGHVLHDGVGYLESKNTKGVNVHQILANYQTGVRPDRGWGGGGFLRLVRFLPGQKTVQLKSYSPWYDTYETSSDQQFTVSLVSS